jgi:hypothetical protein
MARERVLDEPSHHQVHRAGTQRQHQRRPGAGQQQQRGGHAPAVELPAQREEAEEADAGEDQEAVHREGGAEGDERSDGAEGEEAGAPVVAQRPEQPGQQRARGESGGGRVDCAGIV